MTTPDILAAIAADPNVAPAFSKALRPRPLFDTDEPENSIESPEDGLLQNLPHDDTDEPDYSDEAPLPDNAFADAAAADWWAGRTR